MTAVWVPPSLPQAIRRSHVAYRAVEVWRDGHLTATIWPTDGEVTDDATQQIRRTGRIAMSDSMTLARTDELRIFAGVRHPDGTVDRRQIMVGYPTDQTVEMGTGDTIVTVADPAWRIRRNPYLAPKLIPFGTNVAVAIRDELADRAPWLNPDTFRFAETDATTPDVPLGVDQRSDPWAAMLNLADSAGLDLFFDQQGIPVLVPTPDPDTQPPVATFTEGDAELLLSGERSDDWKESYDAVLVRGWQDDGTPIRVTVGDPAGDLFVADEDPLVRTVPQATDKATALLNRKKGAIQRIRFRAIPDPERAAGDVVAVVEQAAGVDGTYVIDTVTHPLGLGDQTATTRRRRVT